MADNPRRGKCALRGRYGILTGRELLQDSLYRAERLRVRLNGAKLWLVEISQRCFAAKNTAPSLFPNASLNVSRKVADVLIRDPEFERHQNDVVGRKIHALERANLLNDSTLKEADDFSAVVEVASDAVKRPTKNPVRFALFDSPKHLVEYLAPRLLGALAFVELPHDNEALLAGDLIEFRILGIDREQLAVFILARFSAIHEVFEHGQILAEDINNCDQKMVKSAKQKVPIDVLRALRGTSQSERILHRLHSVVLVLNGFSCSEVARLYHDSARSVAYWLKRFEENGVSGLAEEERPGRPSKLTPAQMSAVRALAIKRSRSGEPMTGKALSSFINQEFGTRLTIRQCRRILKMFVESR